MDATYADLALPSWRMGQVLVPAQFEVLQAALQGQMAAWQATRGLPSHGVVALAVNRHLLARGALAVDALTVAFADGTLVDVPRNATITNLSLADAPATSVEVYLHVLPPDSGEPRTDQALETERGVERARWRLALALSSRWDRALQSLKLFDLQQDLDGTWRRGPFVPPLLLVGTSPYLDDVLVRLRRALDELDSHLRWALLDAFITGERRAVMQRCRAASFRMRAMLDDITEAGIYRHPFELFDALRAFLVELCLWKALAPEAPATRYAHDDLAACFADLVERVVRMASAPSGALPRVPFVRDDERLTAAPLGKEISQAREVYLVVEAGGDRPSMRERIKLAARSRLKTVHTNALSGVILEPVVDERLRSSFGAGVEMYRVHHGEEWAHAIAEGALSFYASGLEEARAALFWSSR